MSNARIQFSLASEDVWNAYNPQLKEGEIVTVLKANKKVKLVQGKVGGSTYSESTVIWDEDTAETTMSRAEAAAVTATAQANAASGSASKAAASQSAAATSATNAKASETAAKTSETNAKASATSAASSASSASTASTQAGKAADSASASKEAAQSAASNASNFASAARNSAGEAKTYKDNAKTYMDNAKNYSENVNVFLPSVSDSGVLSWTNKAGLANPASVNIKGAKGDKGTAATIEVGTVTTGAAGSSASVTNSGTASNVVLNFTLPRGKDGKDGGVTVDAELSDTSTNPIQNKAVKTAIDTVTASIPTKVSTLENDAGYLTQHQSLEYEKYVSYVISGAASQPASSVMQYTATGAFTLNLSSISSKLAAKEATVFTTYIKSDADYTLTITNAGTIKYIGSASDVAITSAGLLLNIMMLKDASGNVTSIVQASKLS